MRVTQWQEELFRLRCSKAIGQGGDTNRLRTMRRQIARAQTILSEMQRHAASQA